MMIAKPNHGHWAAQNHTTILSAAGEFNEPVSSYLSFSRTFFERKHSVCFFKMLLFFIHSSDKDDKVDLIKSSTPTPTSTVLPSASLGVATTVNIDDCSESDSEIKLEKVNIMKTCITYTHTDTDTNKHKTFDLFCSLSLFFWLFVSNSFSLKLLKQQQQYLPFGCTVFNHFHPESMHN